MPFSPLDIPFGSLDTKTDERMLQNGALLVAENCSAQTVGGYTKRYGYTALTTIASLTRLFARRDELCALDGTTAYSYDAALGTWRTIGSVPDPLTSQVNGPLFVGSDVTKMTCAAANNIRIDLYIIPNVGAPGGTPEAIVTSISDGSVVRRMSPVFAFSDYTEVRAVTCGNFILMLASTANSQSLDVVSYDTTTGATAGPTTIVSGASVDATNAQFDACSISSTEFVVAYKTNAAAVRAARWTASPLASAADQQIAAEAPDGPIGVVCTPGDFGAAIYHNVAAGGVRGVCFSASTMVQTVAPFTVEAITSPVPNSMGMVRAAANSVMAVWDRDDSGTTKANTAWTSISNAGAVGSIIRLRNYHLTSKPYVNGSFFYFNVWYKNSPQQTFFTIRTTGAAVTGFPVAMHAYRAAFSACDVLCATSDVAQISSGVYAFCAPIGYQFLSTGTARAGVATFTNDHSSALRSLPVECLEETVLANGLVYRYDGIGMQMCNFGVYPDIISATPGTVASGGMDDGTYSYVAIFEKADFKGNVDRSTQSIAFSATTSAGAGRGKVDVVISQYTLENGLLGTVSLFRTTANAEANDDGTFTRQFVGSATISNSTQSVTITDQLNDTAMASNRLLYVGLDREPPLPCTHMVLHKNRLWGISSADRKRLFYSGELSPGEAPWFSSFQQVRIDQGGDCTALASMDDKLIAFKSDRTFKFYGSGANALGQNNDLTAAILMTGDAGCTDPRSIAAAHGGLFFKSAKGLYALSRGEELSYGGEAADKYWSSYANIISAEMLTDRQEIRFEVSGGNGGIVDALTGSIIAAQKMVFNYATGQWTTHRNYLDGTAIDAVVVGGVYYWGTSAGAVYKENTASFLDPSSTFVRQLIRVGWVKPAGFQGWVRAQRAMALLTRKTAHSLTMTCENDYVSGTTTASKTWTNAQLATLPREQANLHLVRQKGESYRFTLYDGQDGTLGTGEGATMYGLQLYAQALRGTFEKKLLAAARG